ncbi:MAG: 1-aminocyclopropane-1-carboxylate deaminase/D-cysteine desulfhydrase [Anaerovoracaceae bacterium]|jgi:D-cysteine desulfhydrase
MTLGKEKIRFLNLPTPIDRMDRISEDLNINFYLKRDDLTNFGTGGNKLRKLEYFIKDALDKKATMLLTVGGAQTNHGRLTAAVASKYGLRSAIVAVDPYPGEISANLLLDGIMGCHVYLVKNDGTRKASELQEEAVARVTEEWTAKGENVYYIPMGGSNELGALGYYDCAVEIDRQVRDMGLKNVHLVSTVGSMGTYVGLQTAIANEPLDMKLTGITIMPYSSDPAKKEQAAKEYAASYYERVRAAYDLSARLSPEDFDINAGYDYGAYNNPVRDVREAIYYMGQKEGIILDPCYTGKTFNAIRDLAKKGAFDPDETIVMLHTGGIPGIYTKFHRVEMEKELEGYIHII